MYSLIQAQRDAASSKLASVKVANRTALLPRHGNRAPMKQPPIPTNIKGKDMFDAQLWKDPTSTSVFYTFIASLRRTIRDDIRRTTPTHRFIRTLRDRRKLVRCYTQNIDGLESREDLCMDMDRGKGNRARFTKSSMEQSKALARILPGGDLDGGCEVVQLHGDLEVLRCTLCQQTCPWDEHEREVRLLTGKAPACQACMTANLDRQDRGKRGTKIGILRPNVVLYGEEHPSAEAVGTITAHDLALSPDVLLILGTSLHVHGLKTLVREFAKSVHARAGGKGKVIFVNLSKPSESAWKDSFDFWVSMDCDEWVAAMRRHRHDLFQVQAELKLLATKQSSSKASKMILSPYLTAKQEEDKENISANDLTSTPKAKAPRSMAALPPPKKPLQDQGSSFLSQLKEGAAGAKKAGEQTQKDKQLQLPTPPSTGHVSRFQTPSKKRLVDTYQNMFATPSKRRKAAPTVWEDSDTGL